jgi:hypothetical protein
LLCDDHDAQSTTIPYNPCFCDLQGDSKGGNTRRGTCCWCESPFCTALSCSAVEGLQVLVQLNGHLSEHCRKKAALCLARIFRKLPPEANVITPAEWCLHFRTLLANPFSPGPQLAIMGLLCTVLERSTDGYESLQPLLVENLSASVTGRNNRKEFIYYLYYGILCPWLQCKCALLWSVAASLCSCLRQSCVPMHAVQNSAQLCFRKWLSHDSTGSPGPLYIRSSTCFMFYHQTARGSSMKLQCMMSTSSFGAVLGMGWPALITANASLTSRCKHASVETPINTHPAQ